MTALLSTPRLELLDSLIDADIEVDRLLGQLQSLDRRLGRAHRAMAGPEARTPLGYAYLRRAEGEYEAALGQLRVACREARALAQID